jgi:hypothetical protein
MGQQSKKVLKMSALVRIADISEANAKDSNGSTSAVDAGACNVLHYSGSNVTFEGRTARELPVIFVSLNV